METLFKVIPFAIAGWNTFMEKVFNKRKIHSEKVLNAIVYYSFAISLMGYFDMDLLKEMISIKGAA